MRRLLHRLHNELKLPIYCLLDNDPWGYYIYSVIKQGSINLAFESQRMAIPDVPYLGLRSNDYERCELSDSVQDQAQRQRHASGPSRSPATPGSTRSTTGRRKSRRCSTTASSWKSKSLISKDISYVTEEYVPERLAEQDWLD